MIPENYSRKGSSMFDLNDLVFITFMAGFFPYIYAVLFKGANAPVLSTWAAWFIMDLSMISSMFMSGGVNFQMRAAIVGCFIVLLIALFHPRRKISDGGRVEKLTIGSAVLGAVAAFALRGEPLAIYIIAVVMFITTIPTWVQNWKEPYESRLGWFLFFFSSSVAVLIVLVEPSTWRYNSAWQWKDLAQPLSFFGSAVGMLFIFTVRRGRA